MGIKLHCPNGHKLNVKSFLAGKKGVCPHCGASFRIPGEKQEAAEDAAEAATPQLQSSAVGAQAYGPATSFAEGASATFQPTGASVPVMPTAAVPVVGVPVAGAPAAMVATVRPVVAQMVTTPGSAMVGPPAHTLSPPGAIDPISESPAAAWYVRPPSGGQFGPARGDVMRKWIAEGRVSSDSLVWREGWTDWRNAGGLFPALGAAGPPSSPAALPSIAVSSRASRTSSPAARRQTSGLAIAFLVFLALLCIGLVVALVFVLGGVE